LILTNYGDVLASLGQLPEAVALGQRAVTLDPVNRVAWSHLASFLLSQGKLPAARQAAEHALVISPESENAILVSGIIDLLEGRFVAARDQFKASKEEENRLFGMALAEERLGHVAESHRALEELIQHYSQSEAYSIAQIYAWRGDYEAAFPWLDRARTQRDTDMTDIKIDPLLAGLRGDPRYKALLRKMNLPD